MAYASGGSLRLLELSPGRTRVLVAKGTVPGVGWPVSFSPDGRWVAFSQGLVVAAAGGRVCSPLGRRGLNDPYATNWRWQPGKDTLIGETPAGGLVEATVSGRLRRLPIQAYPTWALDPSGRYIAYGYSPKPTVPGVEQIRVYDLATGSVQVIYRGSRHKVAPPVVAQWSPDGKWILFWPDFDNSASIEADGLPLLAVSTETSQVAKVAPVTLTYNSFLTWCGQNLVAAAGGDRYVTHGKRVVLATPPSWQSRAVTTDPGRSWYEPACSPNGHLIGVISTRNGEEPVFDTWDRSLWLLTPGGGPPEKLLSTPGFSFDNPIWAANGRSVLIVRRQSKPTARASICLAPVDLPGQCKQIADLGRVGFGYYGINGYGLDWYQPRS